MKQKKIFITGISTEVGKTVVAAIITEALKADYWKPIQSGNLDFSDSDKVKQLTSNPFSVFHDNSYALKTPMSPHASAAIDGLKIRLDAIHEPDTHNHLVIEGAGGILVPLNEKNTILDLIKPEYRVIVVSRHYLGSINHTLLTLKILREKGFNTSLIFSGDENASTENIIKKMSGIPVIGRINEEPYFNREVIKKYAAALKNKL